MAVNSSLAIEDITADDGGSYVCSVSNEAGVTEATAVLSVSLYVSGEVVGLNTTSGSVENITCLIEGFPISYHWEKLDDMIINYRLVSIGRVLQFNPVGFGDEGEYRCVGNSGVGDVLTSDEITVSSESFQFTFQEYSVGIKPHNYYATYILLFQTMILFVCLHVILEDVPLSVLP